MCVKVRVLLAQRILGDAIACQNAYESRKQNDTKRAKADEATVDACYRELTADASAVMNQLEELMKTGSEQSGASRLECEKRVDESIRKLDKDRALFSIATDLEDKQPKNYDKVIDVLKRKRSVILARIYLKNKWPQLLICYRQQLLISIELSAYPH